MKLLPILCATLLLLPLVHGWQFNGSTVYAEDEYLKLEVTPHTIYYSSEATDLKQTFKITSKLESDNNICAAYCFDEPLQNGSVTLWKRDGGLLDVTEQFSGYDYNGQKCYLHTTPLSINALEQRTWNLSYTPATGTGKWDLHGWNSPSDNCIA